MMVRESYGFNDITFDNIEQLYNPRLTHIQSVQETTDYLVKRGMSYTLAQKLLQQYIKKIEATSDTFDLIDFFSDSRAKAAINSALAEDIHINYNSNYLQNKFVN